MLKNFGGSKDQTRSATKAPRIGADRRLHRACTGNLFRVGSWPRVLLKDEKQVKGPLLSFLTKTIQGKIQGKMKLNGI